MAVSLAMPLKPGLHLILSTAIGLLLQAGPCRGQGVHAVPGSPGWTQRLHREAAEGPMLKLVIQPMVEGVRMRKGFTIAIHQDNELWISTTRTGRKPRVFKLPPDHLYTVEVTHQVAYGKVIQFDADGLDQFLQLDCDIDLMLRPSTAEIPFEDQLILSMPLSVVWFDEKRNLFRHDTYLHDDGIEQWRSRLTLRDPSRSVHPSGTIDTTPPEDGAERQHP